MSRYVNSSFSGKFFRIPIIRLNKTIKYELYFPEFLTKDHPSFANMNPPEVCIYRAWRYPYYHKNKYQQDGKHWKYLTWKLVSVFIFEVKNIHFFNLEQKRKCWLLIKGNENI